MPPTGSLLRVPVPDPLATLPTRTVAFQLIFNARDLGGLPTVEGLEVRRGRLYRADGVHRLAGDDLEVARALGLRTVIDLRTEAELELRGRFPVAEVPVTWHHLPMIDRVWSEDDLRATDGAATFLRDRYLDMLTEGATSLAAIADLVAQGTPALFHCAAGKDRTGVVAAFLLGLLGVPADVIAEDYHLSAAAMQAVQAWVREHHPEALDAMTQQPEEYLAAPAEAMHGFLEEVDRRHGSMAGLADHLGVPAATVAALRAELLAEPTAAAG